MEKSRLDEKEIKRVADEFPDVLFVWNTELLGKTYSTAVKELNLNNEKVKDFAEFKKQMSYFRNLGKAEMCDCGLENSEMEELCGAYPDVKFVWKIRLGPWTLRTDVKAFSTAYPMTYSPYVPPGLTEKEKMEYYFIPNSHMYALKYCTDLEALDLGHRGISDISSIANLKKLKILILADNKITNIKPLENLENLIYVELFVNSITDLSPLLASKDTLLDLNICWSHVKNTEVLLKLDKLERLWLGQNPVTYNRDLMKELRGNKPDCLIDSVQRESTGGGWRQHERYFWMRDYFGLFYMR